MSEAPRPPLPDSPFRGIEPFRFIDQTIFSAREGEIWELQSGLTIYPAVLLYGDSGTGKSSLINAGLIPRLRQEDFVADRLRVQPHLGKEIKVERISTSVEKLPPYLPSTFAKDETSSDFEISVEEFLQRLYSLQKPAGGKSPAATLKPDQSLILIFDQFEEFVTLFEEAERAAAPSQQGVAAQAQDRLLKALVGLIQEEALPVKILFVFREDYLAKLNVLFEHCPRLLDQYVRLLPPRPEALRQIIRAPFEGRERLFADEQSGKKGAEILRLADKIADELAHYSEGGINLSELQIVCKRLWESGSPATVFKRKRVHELVEDYWADALDKFPEEMRDPAVALLGHMITSSNTRNIISEEDLTNREEIYFKEDVLRKALDALIVSGLVRREPRHKVYFYEIVSEYLVPWIQRLKSSRLAELERVKAQRRYRATQKEAKVLRSWRLGLTVVSALLLATGILLYYHLKRAETAEQEAQQANNVNRQIVNMINLLTSKSSSDRLLAVQEIADLTRKKILEPERGEALLYMAALTDRDATNVSVASNNLLGGDGSLVKKLPPRAYIHLPTRDDPGLSGRAEKVKRLLIGMEFIVPDYQYGRRAPSRNQLRYCRVTMPDMPGEVAKAVAGADGEVWAPILIEGCERSDNVRPDHFEVWFASPKGTPPATTDAATCSYSREQVSRIVVTAIQATLGNTQITEQSRFHDFAADSAQRRLLFFQIKKSVDGPGCTLNSLTPDSVAGAETVKEIVDAVYADLSTA
jgi:hypothetical protein